MYTCSSNLVSAND